MPYNSFLSNQGTQTSLLTDNNGGTAGTLIPVMKIDISPIGTAGTAWNGNPAGGTLGSVLGIGSVGGLSNLPGGSIAVTAGTIRDDPRPTKNILPYGTQVAGTAAIVATLVGSASVGSGTYLWVNELSVNNPNANVGVIVSFGTAQQGTNVLLRGTFGTAGAVGIQKSFPKAVNAGMTNQDLVVSLTAAGTVDVDISYFISA